MNELTDDLPRTGLEPRLGGKLREITDAERLEIAGKRERAIEKMGDILRDTVYPRIKLLSREFGIFPCLVQMHERDLWVIQPLLVATSRWNCIGPGMRVFGIPMHSANDIKRGRVRLIFDKVPWSCFDGAFMDDVLPGWMEQVKIVSDADDMLRKRS